MDSRYQRHVCSAFGALHVELKSLARQGNPFEVFSFRGPLRQYCPIPQVIL